MPPPDRLGRYTILSPLGHGAMGEVYKASDPALDRTVAIKTINPALLAGDELRAEFLERFRREAKAAGRLSHPNIVSVFDLGFDDATATPFIVMEYVPGVSLETVLRENPTLPATQAMEIVEQIGGALEEAHRHGVVHRDIKPANVFLDERGRVKVGDFGVARLEGSDLTQTGVRVGTPGYTAPEVLQGAVADARADVFALGVLAYRLFTGKRAFGGTLPESVAIEVLQKEPDPPVSVRPELSEGLSRAVLHALAKAPAARTPSARAFLDELRSPADMATRTERVRPVIREGRRWLTVAVAAAIALLLGLGAFLANRALTRDQPPTAAAPPATTPVTAPPRRVASPPATTPARLESIREAVKEAEEAWRAHQEDQQGQEKGPGRGKSEEKGHGRGKKARPH